MTSKTLYMKFVSLLFIVIGFGYCLTSFYNLLGYLLGGVKLANGNLFLMIIGLLVPLLIFSFGLYFYFYNDEDRKKINIFLIVVSIIMMIIGGYFIYLSIVVNNGGYNVSYQVLEFLHKSIGYSLSVLSIILIYGIIKYKY